MSEDKGLHVKYIVTKADTKEVVNNCFVLRPDKDPAALAALRAYAYMTTNPDLAADIFGWIVSIEKKGAVHEEEGEVR